MDAAEVAAARVSATLAQDLVFVDLETTGGNPAHHRITEVGIVRVRDGDLVDEWSSLVNPECSIPPHIEAFTGISDEMVAGAPRFAQIAPLMLEKMQGAVFVAHSARFDYSFLRCEFRRLKMRFSAKVLCTVKLSRRLFPQHRRHNLDAVMERHGLSCSARHRALGDARVLRDFWFKLRREVPEAALDAAVQSVLGAAKLPDHLGSDLADELPEGPGVYRYFGEGDILLYVGRSNSLRTRVLGQLATKPAGSGDQWLARDVRRVDWLQTAGELGARLREAAWVKTQRPLRNRRARSQSQFFTLRPADRPGAVGVCAVDEVGSEDLACCFGVFHSEKDARNALGEIARAQRLCLKVLGLEDSAGSCLAFQVGRCKGACVGKEPLALHQLRVELALSSLKLKSWPFPGRVALRERDPPGAMPDGAGGGADLHVVDHWVYLGTARCEEELAALAAKEACGAFDADVYRILERHLSSHPRLEWHDLRDMKGGLKIVDVS
jgi:DNA polymerase III subunit epsilon